MHAFHEDETAPFPIHLLLLFYIKSNVVDFIFIWGDSYCDRSKNSGVPAFIYLYIGFSFSVVFI